MSRRAKRSRPPTRARLDRYEVWRTPGHCIEQGLWAARLLGGVTRVLRVADLGAGAGGFGQRLARVYPGARRLAIEAREEESSHLGRHYEQVIVGDMFADAEVATLRRFAPNLIVANPPYTLALQALLLALACVAVGGHVLFFLRSTFGSSISAWSFLLDTPPTHEFSVAGRPNMRTGVSAQGNKFSGDFVPHTWLLFQRGYRPRRPACVRHFLPPLSPQDLAWSVVPGSEHECPPFPPIYLPENLDHASFLEAPRSTPRIRGSHRRVERAGQLCT